MPTHIALRDSLEATQAQMAQEREQASRENAKLVDEVDGAPLVTSVCYPRLSHPGH